MPNQIATQFPTKLSKLIPMLSSDQDGEVVAAARAIDRALCADGLSFHDIAAALEPAQPKTHRLLTPYLKADQALDHRHMLSLKEIKFLQDVGRLSARGHTLSPRQMDWLNAIFQRVCDDDLSS